MDLLTMLLQSTMLPQLTMPLLSTLPLLTMPQLFMLPLLIKPLSTLMCPPPTPTPMLSLMTTPTPTSTLLRQVMVLAMLRDLIPLLFLMVVSSMLLTRLMAMLAMLLMSPMMELLSTQMPLPLTMLPLPLPMLVNKKHKRKHNKDISWTRQICTSSLSQRITPDGQNG